MTASSESFKRNKAISPARLFKKTITCFINQSERVNPVLSKFLANTPKMIKVSDLYKGVIF